MRIFGIVVLLMLLASPATHARPARAGDVTVSITLRESVAALSWINATNPTAKSAEEMHDLLGLFDDAGLTQARAFVEKVPASKRSGFGLEQVPETATIRALSIGEAKTLIAVIAPSKDHPQNLELGRILSALSDKATAALGSHK